jgi:hypothetical protein
MWLYKKFIKKYSFDGTVEGMVSMAEHICYLLMKLKW